VGGVQALPDFRRERLPPRHGRSAGRRAAPAAAPQAAAARAAFDLGNGHCAGKDYLIVATGRDHTDAAPTSGTYLGTARGMLTAIKRVGVTLA
jgi:hypothetical protein